MEVHSTRLDRVAPQTEHTSMRIEEWPRKYVSVFLTLFHLAGAPVWAACRKGQGSALGSTAAGAPPHRPFGRLPAYRKMVPLSVQVRSDNPGVVYDPPGSRICRSCPASGVRSPSWRPESVADSPLGLGKKALELLLAIDSE